MHMPAVGRVLYRLSKPGETLAAGAQRSDPGSSSATRYAELGFYLTTNTGTRLRGFDGRAVTSIARMHLGDSTHDALIPGAADCCR